MHPTPRLELMNWVIRQGLEGMSFALTGRGSHVWPEGDCLCEPADFRAKQRLHVDRAHGRRRHSDDRRGGGGSRISSLECAISAPTGHLRNCHAAYARPYGGNESEPKRGRDGPDDRGSRAYLGGRSFVGSRNHQGQSVRHTCRIRSGEPGHGEFFFIGPEDNRRHRNTDHRRM